MQVCFFVHLFVLIFKLIIDNLTHNTNLTNRSPTKAMDPKLHSCPSAPPGYIDEVTENMSIKDSKSSLDESKKSDDASTEQKKEGLPGDEMESSDDSYVKVCLKFYKKLMRSK